MSDASICRVASPLLANEIVTLRPLVEADAPRLYEVGADPEIWRYMPVKIASEDDMAVWVRAAVAEMKAERAMVYTITETATNQLLGCTRLFDFSAIHRHVEIGFTWLTPRVWRSAVNTNCKYLLLRESFESLGLVRVQLKTDRRNVRSQRAIERIGGVYEGTLRRHWVLPDGHIRDSVYYSILDLEWPDVKARLEGMLGTES